jgi:hypothetical protein
MANFLNIETSFKIAKPLNHESSCLIIIDHTVHTLSIESKVDSSEPFLFKGKVTLPPGNKGEVACKGYYDAHTASHCWIMVEQ